MLYDRLVFRSILIAVLAFTALAERPSRPEWVDDGLVMASNMEALSFVRRRGGQAANYTELWEREQTEQAVLDLKAQGVNAVLISLMKGAGLKAEAEDIELARRYVELGHKHGLKVGGYIGGSIFFETMFADEPGAREWIQRDETGRPLFYNPNQTFRYMANRSHPGYRDFIKRVLERGIGELKMDFVHFDQMMWWRLPYASYTETDQRAFAAFIRHHYPPERMKARFGYSEMGALRIPEFGLPAMPTWSEVVNPLMQELMQFRSESLAERFAEYDAFIHELNPKAALQANPPLDPSANNAVMYGVDVPRLLAHGDMITSEERNEPGYTTDGRLISRIRTFRAGRTMGKPILFWQQPATIVGRPAHHVLKSDRRLRLAEAMAFCDNCLGLTAGLDVGNERFPPEAQRYVEFFRKRNELFARKDSAAEVAVLRSFASTELNASAVLPSVLLFEQSLIQSGIPFATIYDRHLDDLKRYKVLVLANQDALSQEQVEKIGAYVRAGGGIVATGETGLYTQWRLRRPAVALADHYGKGRAIHIARVEPAIDPPPPQLYYVFRNEFWRLAKNHAEMIRAVRTLLTRPVLSAAVPDSVAVEFTRDASTYLAHLVNYRVAAPVMGPVVRFDVPEGKRLVRVVAESPDAPAQTLRPETAGSVATVRLPRLDIYSVISFQLEDKR